LEASDDLEDGDDYDSVSALATAFNTGIDQRDSFLGRKRCVICGMGDAMVLRRCHIVGQAELRTWSDLRRRGWVPSRATAEPRHDLRNGLLLCCNHRVYFNGYAFFLRFLPDTQKFVFINYSGSPGLQDYHGKAVALDVKDPHVPIPSLFIIHEMRVRGFHPFAPLNPSIPNDTLWQNWIESDGVYDPVSHSFKRDGPPLPADNGHSSITALPQFPTATTNTGGASSNKHSVLPLNADVIADILAATRAMPSWKACEEEGTTTWTGTAEENIHKYTE
jgi:hypothetical protein